MSDVLTTIIFQEVSVTFIICKFWTLSCITNGRLLWICQTIRHAQSILHSQAIGYVVGIYLKSVHTLPVICILTALCTVKVQVHATGCILFFVPCPKNSILQSSSLLHWYVYAQLRSWHLPSYSIFNRCFHLCGNTHPYHTLFSSNISVPFLDLILSNSV